MPVLDNKQDRIEEAEEHDDDKDALVAVYTPIIERFYTDLNADIARHYLLTGQILNTFSEHESLIGILEEMYADTASVFSDKLRVSTEESQGITSPQARITPVDLQIESIIDAHNKERALQESTIILSSYQDEVDKKYDMALSSIISDSDDAEGIRTINIDSELVAGLATAKLNGLSESRAFRVSETEIEEAAEFDKFAEASTLVAAGAVIGAVQFLEKDTFKQWVSMRDHRVRPAHVQADGQTKPLNDYYIVMDQMLMYPGDPTFSTPDNTVGCRCVSIFFTL